MHPICLQLIVKKSQEAFKIVCQKLIVRTSDIQRISSQKCKILRSFQDILPVDFPMGYVIIRNQIAIANPYREFHSWFGALNLTESFS